jgi:hypothetical protein
MLSFFGPALGLNYEWSGSLPPLLNMIGVG